MLCIYKLCYNLQKGMVVIFSSQDVDVEWRLKITLSCGAGSSEVLSFLFNSTVLWNSVHGRYR